MDQRKLALEEGDDTILVEIVLLEVVADGGLLQGNTFFTQNLATKFTTQSFKILLVRRNLVVISVVT